MLIESLSIAVPVSAFLHIRAEYRGPRRHVYTFKPVTILLILLIAALIPSPVSSFYKITILCGLLFSLFGDIFLMLPKDRFVAGLVSFLIAHLFYISAFAFTEPIVLSGINLLPFVLTGIVLFGILKPHLGNLKLPVLVYIIVITSMTWLALNRWLSTDSPGCVWAFVGALFFMASDAMLAFDRFKSPFSKARFFVLTTYVIAQWLFAFSITSGYQ
ncbi:MAG: lysoplasmalogenase [bacterium]